MDSLRERVKDLETWVNNLSYIQDQLLKELGYEIRSKRPITDNHDVYLHKIKRKSEEGET